MSRLLLDSHAMLWSVAHDSARSGTAKTLIQAADEVFVSEASAWEAAIKYTSATGPWTRRAPRRFSMSRCYLLVDCHRIL